MEYTQITGLVLVIVALCEAIKRARIIQSKYIPLLAIFLGIAGSVYLSGFNWITTSAGLILGLSTTGGYHLVKQVLTKEY